MAEIVPVFIFLNEASISASLDLAFDLVDLVLWGGYGRRVTTDPSYSGFEFEVHLDQFFARQALGVTLQKRPAISGWAH